MIEGFYKVCSTSLDTVAPLKHKRVKGSGQPWLNETTRAFRQEFRKAERRWKKDKLHVSFDILKSSLSNYQIAVKHAKSSYFSQLIADNVNRPKALFDMIDSLLNPTMNSLSEVSSELCEDFLNYFTQKNYAIRTSIAPSESLHLQLPCTTSCLSSFQPVLSHQLYDIVSTMKCSGSKPDTIPARLFKDVFPSISPILTAIVNCSLAKGVVPASFKHAVVQPLLKKPQLDPAMCCNFRPISKLSFISKLLEKVVFFSVLSTSKA